MTAAQGIKPLVKASLRALVNPPAAALGAAPRDILVTVSGAWADDTSAWRLARHLIPEAEAYMAEIERQATDRPGDDDLVRLQGRARYAHVVAVALYRDLRVPGRGPA
jgi:hypothetical protein